MKRNNDYELNIGINAWRILNRELNRLGIEIEEGARDLNTFNINIHTHNYVESSDDDSLKKDFDPRGGCKANYKFTLTKKWVDSEQTTGSL